MKLTTIRFAIDYMRAEAFSVSLYFRPIRRNVRRRVGL